MKTLLKLTTCALFVVCLISTSSTRATAQQQVNNNEPDSKAANLRMSGPANATKPEELTVDEKLQRMEKLIELQQQEIKELRAQVERIAAADKNSVQLPTQDARVDTAATAKTGVSTETTSSDKEAETAKAEPSWLNRIERSGDLRFRFESFRNQGFDNPIEAASRNRLRIRARLELKSNESKCLDRKCFDFGLKLATGNFTDNISTNQTLTDFYERKPFALERAFVKFTWKFDDPWKLELTAGKFEPTFRRTQVAWDDDVNVEGVSEALSLKQEGKLYGVKLVAFQLPFGEVPADKDGMLYGGQLQTDWAFGKKTKADVNAGYFSWNHADQVLLGLGAAATQVNGGISNGAALTGGQNGDLGTTNRVILRDPRNGAITLDPKIGKPIGFVANFNLLDVLGNYVWQANDKTPVRFSFDYVHNLSQRINDENNGYWASIEVHRTKCVWKSGKWSEEEFFKEKEVYIWKSCDDLSKKGDWLLGYTFTRIQQDAVLVPFNFSDILASNSRAHIPTFAYVPRTGIVLQWTGLFSQRANKVFPLSPVNRWLNRLQFDVIYKFK